MPHTAEDNGYREAGPGDAATPPAASATVASDPAPPVAAIAGPPPPAELQAASKPPASSKSPSPQKRKRKAPAKKPPVTKKVREKLDDPGLHVLFMDLLEVAAKKPTCPESHGKCQCLHVLRCPVRRDAVANYCVWVERTHDKRMKDQKALEWIKLASRNSKEPALRPKLMFPIPYDWSHGGDADYPEDSEKVAVLEEHCVCKFGLQTIFEMGPARYRSVVAATKHGMVAANGNTGRATRIPETDPRMPPIRAHFEELIKLHKQKVRATKAVREMAAEGTSNIVLKEDDDNVVWLDSTAGPRPLYYRYAYSQGYNVTRVKRDGLDIKPRDPNVPEAQRKPIVSLRTYCRIWKRDYAFVKVSGPHNDICSLCVKFRNDTSRLRTTPLARSLRPSLTNGKVRTSSESSPTKPAPVPKSKREEPTKSLPAPAPSPPPPPEDKKRPPTGIVSSGLDLLRRAVGGLGQAILSPVPVHRRAPDGAPTKENVRRSARIAGDPPPEEPPAAAPPRRSPRSAKGAAALESPSGDASAQSGPRKRARSTA